MSCGCGDSDVVNQTRCGNPCAATEVNTAACETLPSQIENFTIAFFGEVTKTEVDGSVTWVLPCSLETGLTNNPRLAGEGLACYFLRLFDDGIIGLTGPVGDDGDTGTPGFNAFTVVTASFTQPTLAAPNVSISTFPNPALTAGLYLFIQSSGWYIINAADSLGTLNLTLQKALAGAPATITAGKLVVPSGFPGESIVGAQGIQGVPGSTGTPGQTLTAQNAFYHTNVGVNFNLPLLYAAVDFTTSQPEVTLTNPGRYLITASVQVAAAAPIVLNDGIALKLRDDTSAIDVPGSERTIRGFVPQSITTVVLNAIYETVAASATIQLYGRMDTANSAFVAANFTSISAVRLS